MKKISIYNAKDNQSKRELIAHKLKQSGFFTTRNGELLIVVGGDGTFLSAVMNRFDQNPIFVGFNAGNLGFFSEYSMDDLDEFIRMLQKEEYWIQEYPLYEVHYKENNQMKVEYFLNDAVIERKGSHALHMGVLVDDQSIGTVSADGIIFSTAIGSTGYNMSAGGAISLSSKPFLQMKTVAAIHSSAYKSIPNGIILDDESDITVFPTIKKQRPLRIVCDGKEIRTKNVRYVEIKKSTETFRVLRSNNYNHITHMKAKIMPNEG